MAQDSCLKGGQDLSKSLFTSISAMASQASQPTRPVSAYWRWLGENREKIAKMLGSGKGSEVAKKGGEMWKALPDSAKKPFEQLAKEKKVAFEKFAATQEGQKAIQEAKAAKAGEKAEKTQKAEAKAEVHAQKEEKKNERACKAAVKAVEKDDALKKPQSSYWLWLNDNRKSIADMVGGKITEVAKKGGEMWKALPDAKRAPYEKKAKEQKEKHDAYIASEEGQKALKAFKDAKNEATEQFKPKEILVAETTESEKKRKAETDGTSPEKDVGAKKAKGRPSKVQKASLGA